MASNAIRGLYKLYIGNIPWTAGTNELKKYFSKFGPIYAASVIFDKNTGLSKNYGFVIYSNKEGFDSVLNLPNHKLEGNLLKVEPADTN